jgi:hypothetical protein
MESSAQEDKTSLRVKVNVQSKDHSKEVNKLSYELT